MVCGGNEVVMMSFLLIIKVGKSLWLWVMLRLCYCEYFDIFDLFYSYYLILFLIFSYYCYIVGKYRLIF